MQNATQTENNTASLQIWQAMFLIILFGPVGVLAHELERGYRMRLENAATDTQRIALILEEQVSSVILRTDTVLDHIADELAPRHGRYPLYPEELHVYLEKFLRRFPELSNIRILKADGCTLASAVEGGDNPCYADRGYFIRHRDNPRLGLDISEPLVGRTSHDWQLMLSRRIDNPDGSFVGIVSARFSLSFFEDFFKSVELGASSNITLLNQDFRVVARHPIDPSQMLKSVVGGPIETAARLDPVQGTARGISSVDGIERIYGYRRVGPYPLTIAVGFARREVLSEWRNDAMIEIAVTLGLLASIAWLSYHLLKRLRLERENQQRFSEIAGTMGEALYVIDGNGAITFGNPEICSLLGWSEGELLGQNPHLLFHHHKPDGSAYPAELCEIANVITNAHVFRSDDETFWRKDGTSLAVSVISSPIVRRGNVVGSVVTFQDVTRRKQAERQLKHLNETLEDRVKEEVAQNLKKEHMLIQQSRLATMGEMIGNIAHQWRQPLNVLALLLAEIEDAYAYRELNPEFLKKTVADGQGMIQKMSATIDDFRNFFKPNKEKERFVLGNSVADAANLIGPSLTGHAIEIKVENAGDILVEGYPNELSQVLLNIFANAKETFQERKPSGGKIVVSCGADGGNAHIWVRDDAGGIPDEILPKVFDPYFTTKEKGTGIGLYMSKMIVDHMGGSVEARNTGDGAEFRITIPLSPES